MSEIEGGDAQTLIDILASRADMDDEFYYRVKLDDHGRLSNVFWRSSEMLNDYMIFGDVMVFDTTYRTNKYNLICAPFVGVNNHWRNVMFGCAFLSNEKEETFIWLFETFIKSMLGKEPDSIFTDQDLAMSGAIEKVFRHSRHRLCTWHIHKNAISHFGKLKRDASFQQVFNKCLKMCETEDEFYQTWNFMIEKFNLANDTWFTRLFELRNKWCNALNKDHFSAGFLSSQRSESTNRAISFRASKTTSLTEFYKIFEDTTKRWKRVEVEDENASFAGMPDTRIRMHTLEEHAIKVYTREMFKDFEEEFRKGICAKLNELETLEGAKAYEVELDGRKHIVLTTTQGYLINCSCRRITEMKMLCCHMLRVMHLNSWQEIPQQYIFDRWRKNAREKLGGIAKNRCTEIIGRRTWKDCISKTFNQILMECDQSDECRNKFEEAMLQLDQHTKNFRSNDEPNDVVGDECEARVLDPIRTKTKGRSKRVKSFLEKRRKTRNNKCSTEFGSTTPKRGTSTM